VRDDDKAVFVYTTWPSTEAAAACGRRLVEAGSAACVNILPGMTSIYRWEGVVESATEAVMIIKTMEGAVGAVEALVHDTHEAQVPAFVVVPLSGGSRAFLDWIAENSGQNQRAT
jgi:periplasmic divalent cation tolerance protein